MAGKSGKKLFRTFVIATAFVGFSLLPAAASAEVHKFTISDLVCRYVACQPVEGEEGEITLQVEGDEFHEWAGHNLLFRVYRLADRDHGDIVIDSKVVVSEKGHLATDVPVSSLEDGNYYLAFYSAAAPGKPVAVGMFTRKTEPANR